ncbi:molybdate ABC transporter substrate-binding protein [Paucibacter soli]|uniref:molybdate ABC transporter substrate-binding protein n=1 Tax=Paucibacter soli TaxID=3133433 RepID=UPI003098EE0D
MPKHPIATLLLSLLGLAGPAAQAADLTVSAASSLSNAFRELAPAFEARHPGTRLLLNFAASDALLAQIAKGAPVDVFAAADQESMDRAEAQGLLARGSRRNFAANRLVLVTPAQGGLALATLAELRQPAVRRIALGKPEGVPAGRYARAALQAAQLWEAIEPKAVYAQNVRQALDYVARGEVEAGLVYATDALAYKDKVKARFGVATATPISYPVAGIAGSANAAAAAQFLAYLLSPTGQAVLARHGFLAP